jgi:hypothetical protein
MENKKETEFMAKTNDLMDEIYKVIYGKDIFILIATLVPLLRGTISQIEHKDVRNTIIDKAIKELKEAKIR